MNLNRLSRIGCLVAAVCLLPVWMAQAAASPHQAAPALDLKWQTLEHSAGPGSEDVTVIAPAADRVYLAAGAEVQAFDRGTRTLKKIGLATGRILALCPVDDRLWIGTERGLAMATLSTVTTVEPGPEVNGVTITALAYCQKKLFLGTANGLWAFEPGSGRLTAVTALAGLSITHLRPAGPVLAVVASQRAISLLDPDSLTAEALDLQFNSLQSPVTDVAFQGDLLWFATDGSGLIGFNLVTRTWIHLGRKTVANAEPNLAALAVSGRYLWIAGFSGLSRYDSAENHWSVLPPEGGPERSYLALAVDGTQLWEAVSGGIVRHAETHTPWVRCAAEQRYYGNESARWRAEARGAARLDWRIAYRDQAKATRWLTQAAALTGRAGEKICSLDLGRLPDGMYQVEVSVQAGSGEANFERFTLVRETAPIVLTYRTGTLRPGIAMIEGTYAPPSVTSIRIEPGGVAAQLDLEAHTFKAEFQLTGEKQIRMLASDRNHRTRTFLCPVRLAPMPSLDVIAGDDVFSPGKEDVPFTLRQEHLGKLTSWELNICGSAGEPVRSLGGGGELPAVLVWDTRDEEGQVVSPGGGFLYWLTAEEEGGLKLTTPQRPLRAEAATANRPYKVAKIKEPILFDPGKTEIKPYFQGVLDELPGLLTAHPGGIILVAGHADDRPVFLFFRTNQALSEARAAAVVEVLVRKYGVERRKIAQVGFGSTRPIASNKTWAERYSNRRVEIWVVEK
jgi:outer membrane protein OmpA-like peptidoglycan-associated protein